MRRTLIANVLRARVGLPRALGGPFWAPLQGASRAVTLRYGRQDTSTYRPSDPASNYIDHQLKITGGRSGINVFEQYARESEPTLEIGIQCMHAY